MKNFQLVKHFLLRRAGFPFHLLDVLVAPQSSSLAERIARLEAEATQIRHRLLSEVFTAEVASSAAQGNRDRLRSLSRLRHCVGHNREPAKKNVDACCVDSDTLGPLLIQWITCKQQSQLARNQLEHSIHAEQLAVRSQLKKLFSRTDILEAIFLLSPDFFEAVDRWSHSPLQEISTSKERAFEQRLFLFLQRLASKNETTSFFGPLTYGFVSQDIPEWTFGPETKEGIVQRKAFASFWAVAALGRAACREASLRRALPIRRLGIASIRGKTAYTALGKNIEIDTNTAKLFHAITGQTTVDRLAIELDLSVAECEKIVSWLERQGLVRRDLEPSSTEAQPLAELRSRLPEGQAGDLWRDVFDRFSNQLQSFSDATLPERQHLLTSMETMFRDITGEEPRRAAGHMYADRQILYEDCAGDMQPVLCPASEANRIEQELAPILRLGAAYGELRHRAIRTLATRVLEEIGSPVPFLTFAQAIDHPARREELKQLLEPARIFIERLRQRLVLISDDETSDSKVAHLHPRDISDLIEIEPTARAVSLDLMFERRPNMPPQIILGEAHPYVFAWGSQAYFASHKSEVLATFAHDLTPWGGREHMATVLRRRQHKGLVSNDFPGRFIEVSGYANVDPERRIAIADVMVVASEKGPVLQAPDGKELSLYVGENDHLHLLCFAPAQVEMPLIRCGIETPRIQIGDVVYQRRRWELPENALSPLATAKSAADLAVEIARQRIIAGWPRYLFAKSSSEPKPICLDLNVSFAHTMLQKLLQKGALTLVEMLPCPQALWLQRHTGTHTSELRVQFVL